MKLIWKTKFFDTTQNFRANANDVYCKPFLHNGNLVYLYTATDEASEYSPYKDQYICAAVIDKKSGAAANINYKIPDNSVYLGLPSCWEAVQKDGAVFIDTGKFTDSLSGYNVVRDERGELSFKPYKEKDHYYRKKLKFDLSTFTVEGEAEPPRKKLYNDARQYEFDDYWVGIAPKSVRKLQCTSKSTGKILWTFKFVGYLYSQIEERNGVIYFGTAGQGGRFYALNLADGTLLHDVNTRGTEFFSLHNDKALFHSEYGDLQAYNLENKTSEILNVGENSYLNSDVEFLIEGNLLYAIVAEIAKGVDGGKVQGCYAPVNLYVVCCDVED